MFGVYLLNDNWAILLIFLIIFAPTFGALFYYTEYKLSWVKQNIFECDDLEEYIEEYSIGYEMYYERCLDD